MSMLPLDNMRPKKSGDVSFYDPASEREAARKKMMAEMLIGKGNTPLQNETAGGMTVARSPWENINQGAQKYMGEYQLAQADEQAAGLEQNRQKMIQEALANWGSNPQAAAGMLAQDPRTSEMAMKLMQGEVDYGRDQSRFEQEMAFKDRQLEAFNQRASMGGGNIPAPMQIANQMFELEQSMSNPNLPEEQRFLAERQYNLLGQAAKTYGFDRGMQVSGLKGYNDVYGGNQQNPDPFAPNTPPPQMGSDMMNQGLQMEQVFTGGQNNPPVVPTDSLPTVGANMPRPAQASAAPVISSILGYDEAMATRESLIEGRKAKEKSLNEPIPSAIVQRQDEIVEKINIAQGLESRMGKFVSQIDSGQLDLGFIANLENAAKNNLGMSTEQSRNLESFKANLENLRNESLRLNTGVQTDGDAQRAWNELVANINDPQVVRQRLSEIAEINKIGAQLQNQRLNLMRSEYGRGALEIPNVYNQGQQSPQRDTIIQTLRASGANQDEINAYLQARGF